MTVSLIAIGTDYLVVCPAINNTEPVVFRLSALSAWTPESYGTAARVDGEVICLACKAGDLLYAIAPADPTEAQPEPTPEERKAAADARRARSQYLLERSAR